MDFNNKDEQSAIETIHEETDAGIGDFFAPACTDLVDGLIGQYKQARNNIDKFNEIVQGELGGVIHYFIEGNAGDEQLHRSIYVDKIFQVPGAVAALNAAYWSKAMSLTDVYDAMPQARRDEWNRTIKEQTTPEFEEQTVRATLLDLLNSRQRFLAERVDGIFRALSGEHVTNSPAAFGKRMILARLIDSYGNSNHSQVGYINDLRCVIAKFMDRDEPKWHASSEVVEWARSHMRGQWVTLDGGSLRLRAYKYGTAHLEVHPGMAWRLNCILSTLYPSAIPSEFRTKPRKKTKEFVMMGRPLPFAVLALLSDMKSAYRFVPQQNNLRHPYRQEHIKNAMQFDHGYTWEKTSSHIKAEAEAVISSIGGVQSPEGWWQFDYDPHEIIKEIVCSGCLPDQKTHQFYPTPESLAKVAIEIAGIEEEEEGDYLEPEAGLGGLAKHMPKNRTTCVEISPLHCKVLETKGFNVIQADFLIWADEAIKKGIRFDKVVMNPPFSDGRAVAHVEAAAALVKAKGSITSILPSGMREKYSLPGFDITWSRIYNNEFVGTDISVTIMNAVRK